MNRWLFLVASGALALAGCEQTRPPTPEGLKAARLRTAIGTINTKLEAKAQPSPPRAEQVSVWDLKVFDIHDKPGGVRAEWKFFNPLPQPTSDIQTTEALMNAWLISKDGRFFLPQKPVYKQFGSFLTDWTIPQGGPYTLWVEYQPVVAKDELSGDDLKGSKILPIEHARWEFTVEASSDTPAKPLTPQVALDMEQRRDGTAGRSGTQTVYSLEPSDYGTRAPMRLSLATKTLTINQKTALAPRIEGARGEIAGASLVALSPDGKTLVHEVGASTPVVLGQKGTWRAWYAFSLDGKSYAAPFDLIVG